MRLPALSIEDLRDGATLEALLAERESDALERKRTADAETLAKAISGFANANGGWLVLGVDDDGSVFGWQPPGRADPRDWLRDALSPKLDDPLPQFAAEVFERNGKSLGVVHVSRSADAPHFMTATGEVYERRNGQTKRASARRVRELYRRGGDARRAALTRLGDARAAPGLSEALDAPRAGTAMPANDFASIIRVSLEDSPETLEQWVHSREARNAGVTFVDTTAHVLNSRRASGLFLGADGPGARTTLGGFCADIAWDDHELGQVVVAWDAVGVAGVRFAGRRDPVYHLSSNRVRDTWLVSALEYLLDALERVHAYGPAIFRWNLNGVRDANVSRIVGTNTIDASGCIPRSAGNLVEVDVHLDIGQVTASEAADALWLRLERLADVQ